MALLMSLTALAIDAILPALLPIQQDLQIEPQSHVQLLISSVILGMGFGVLLFGPLSDQYGRKPVLLSGLLIFMLGCVLPHLWPSFEGLLVARTLQGIGAAAPRVITQAMVRDGYSGRAMAKIMSLIMSLFILVPILAPWIGQTVMQLSGGWQRIFDFMLLLALVSAVWFAWGQAETLPSEQRRRLSFSHYKATLRHIFNNSQVWGYTLIAGLLFGAFLGYLSSAAAIFQQMFALEAQFPLYFAVLASGFGVASLLNSRIVQRVGMFRLLRWAMTVLGSASVLYLLAQFWAESASLPVAMLYLFVVLFCFGWSFGNLNAVAMLPLGREAGMGAALIGFMSTFISVPLGAGVGQLFNQTLIPLSTAFLSVTLISLWLMHRLPRPEE